MNDKYTKQLEAVTCQGMTGKPCPLLINKQFLLDGVLLEVKILKQKKSKLFKESIYLLDTIENGEVALIAAEERILELRRAQKEGIK